MKILVTGGAGFMGSNFVKYLLSIYPYQVTVLDALTYAGNLDNFPDEIKNNPNFSFLYGNIRNLTIVRKLIEKSNVVVHFAAETHVARSIEDNTIFFETDVLGTQVLINSLLNSNVKRFVHISTSEVYGDCLFSPMTEEHPLDPTTPYASAKTGADRLAYSYYKPYGLPVIIVRPFNNFGPYQHLEKVIPRFITCALLDEPLTIHGKGKNSRDFLYVNDTSRALDLIIHTDLKKVKGEVINLGGGRAISIESIARTILRKLKKPSSLITYLEDRPGQIKKQIASYEKARKILNWKPEIDFEKGLKETIEWYKDNPSWWKRLLYMRSVPIITPQGKKVYY